MRRGEGDPVESRGKCQQPPGVRVVTVHEYLVPAQSAAQSSENFENFSLQSPPAVPADPGLVSAS